MSKRRLTLRRQRGAADQVTQHVMDGDRLDAGVHPLGGDHGRQALGEVAEHLERRRSAADDHRGLQRGRRHAAGQQDVADLRAGAQVRRQFPGLPGDDAAQIDDALHSRGFRGRGEGLRRGAVAPFERRVRAEGVDEVVGDVHALQGAPHRALVHHVGDRDLNVVRPRAVAELAWIARHAPDRVSALSSSGTSRPPMYPDAPVTRQFSGDDMCRVLHGPAEAMMSAGSAPRPCARMTRSAGLPTRPGLLLPGG